MRQLGGMIVIGGTIAARAAALALARRGVAVSLAVDPTVRPEAIDPRYRAWSPILDPALVQFADRGVDLLEALWEESRRGFSMDRRGELWLGSDGPELEVLRTIAGRAAAMGLGPLREHTSHEWYLPGPPSGVSGVPGGLDLIEGAHAVRGAFPALALEAPGGLHVRRAGAVDGAAFGRWLDRALEAEEVPVRMAALVGVDEVGGYHRIRLSDRTELIGSLVVADQTIPRALTHAAPLEEWARITAVVATGKAPDDSPSIRLKGDHEEWVELLPGREGWTLSWLMPGSRLSWAGDRGDDLVARVSRSMGAIESRSRTGFTTAISSMRLAADRRPILAPVGGGWLMSFGHGGSIPSALAAAEAIAEFALEGQWPRYAQPVIGAANATSAAIE